MRCHIAVHLGCYNKIPQTGWFIHNRNLLLTVWEVESPRSGWQNGWVRALFQFAVFSLCSCIVERAKELCGVSFVRVPVLYMKALQSWPNHFSKAPLPNTITVGIKISTYEFGGEEHKCSDHNRGVLLFANSCDRGRWAGCITEMEL